GAGAPKRNAATAGPAGAVPARPFDPVVGGKGFPRMPPPPHQHVAIVDGDRQVAHAHLSGTGVAHFDVFEAQHLGAAVLMETKRLAHGASSFDRRSIISARSSSALKRGCAAICGDSATLSNPKSSSSRRPGAS